jgi:septum formation protein
MLLEAAGIAVETHPSGVDETPAPGADPVAHALDLAVRKAASGPADRVVLAADTVVHRAGALFDKPTDRAEAAAHLAALSGAWHAVTTAVCCRRPGRPPQAFQVTTRVRLRTLSAAEIAAYVATGEADDKAGAYAIQGRGAALVAAIEGSYTAVVGLPLEETLAALAAA